MEVEFSKVNCTGNPAALSALQTGGTRSVFSGIHTRQPETAPTGGWAPPIGLECCFAETFRSVSRPSFIFTPKSLIVNMHFQQVFLCTNVLWLRTRKVPPLFSVFLSSRMSGLFAAIILSFVASFRFSLSIFSLFAFFTSLVWCLCGNLPVFCSLFVPLSFLSLFLFVLIYLVQSLVTFFLAACLASLMRSSSFVLAFAFFYFFSLFDFVLFLVYLLSADRMSGLFTVYILPVFCAPCFVLLSLFSLVSLRLCLCRMSRAYLPLTCVHASYSLDSLHRSCSSVLLFDFSSLCESHSCELRFAMCLYVLCYLYNWKLFFGSFL